MIKKMLLADDHSLIRQGLKSLIETFHLADEILEAENGTQVIDLSLQHHIDLFILDFRMPVMGGYDTAKLLLTQNPKTKIVIITAYSESDMIVGLLALGVRGFVSKNTTLEELQFALTKVLAGEIYVNKIHEAQIIREQNFSNQSSAPITFTKRENQLIALMSKGKTSKEISLSLEVTQKTIEIYRSRLLNKVGVKNSIELIDYFHINGLL
jgi:DNA-binding NarL/FixJ family response regulator